jgi:membrane protease YdiL (CAAX protease family)
MNRGHVLGVLIAALIGAEFVKDVLFSIDRGEWLPAYEFVYYGVITCLPFLLAKWAPKAAGFEIQWLPDSRRHWALLLGMVLLLLLVRVLLAALAATVMGSPPPRPVVGPTTATGIVLMGIASVLVAPIAEEIFFRGYVLEQMRRLTSSSIAVFVQAVLFGLSHAYVRGLLTSHALSVSVNAFFVGIVLGAWRLKLRSLLPLILAHVLLNATLIVPLKVSYDQVTAKSAPIRHTVSRETTYITEPLRPDGSVEYVAELNRRHQQGVTPRNNAAVLFWRAVGPKEILPEYRTKYFGMLGIRPLREKGNYFVDFATFVARRKGPSETNAPVQDAETRDEAWELLALATQRPWTEEEFPVLAEWLTANERPLKVLADASNRPRRYDPLCCRVRTPLISVLLPANMYSEVAQPLCARAMLRLGEGKLEEAQDDLLVCHRLARLASQGQTLVEACTAFSVEETACTGDKVLLQHAHLSAAQIAEMREDLDRLPPMLPMIDKLDVERFTYLDTMSDYSRQGIRSVTDGFTMFAEIDDAEYGGLMGTVDLLSQQADGMTADWDVVLRMGNSWHDRIVEAYRRPTAMERIEALNKIEADLRKLKESAADARSLEKQMLDNPRQALSERLGQILLIFFFGDPTHFAEVEHRATMRFELVKLGFALAAYRTDHGSYPATLGDLVPDYVTEVPADIFTGSALRYRRQREGYLLYSVGINGKSDGARGYDDRKNEEDWDDLIVRVPALGANL